MGKESIDKELQATNRLVSICLTIECSIINVAYLAEFLKGARTLAYVLLTIVLCTAIPLSCWLAYGKRKDNNITKHILGIGFPLFYIFILFSTENTLAFTYAIPVLIISSSYADSKYSLKEAIGFTICNVCEVIHFFGTGVYSGENTASMEIHILIVMLIAGFSYFATRRVEINNRERETRINHEMEKTKSILDRIVAVSQETNSHIDLVCNDMSELGKSIKNTSEAMQNVDSGAEETTKTVEMQKQHTKNISEKIETVSNNYEEIDKNISDSLSTIMQSKVTITELSSKTNETIEKGNDVTNKLNNLDSIMANMNTAVDIISEITSQTSLLSLNASIEAARAGEAGRGFAVVASEIQKMANDTQDAAVKIQTMVDDVTKAISDVVDVTSEMISQIMDQAKTTEETVTSFEKIGNNTEAIKSCANEMSSAVEELNVANQEIVESIETIASISNEVSVNANATLNSCEDNIQTVDKITDAMNVLSELASSLIEEKE